MTAAAAFSHHSRSSMPISRSLSFEDPNISAWGGADPSTSAVSAVPEVVELDAAAIVEKEGLVK